jgi:hypothetical protein
MCALFCVDLLILQRHNLMYFTGDIGDCLKVLRQNQRDVLTSELMDRCENDRRGEGGGGRLGGGGSWVSPRQPKALPASVADGPCAHNHTDFCL